MEIKDQVVSLELAKKLKELGVKQESLFYWDKGKPLHGSNIEVEVLRYSDDGQPFIRENRIPAFTVAELGEMLNKGCATNFDDFLMQQFGAINGFMIYVANPEHWAFPADDSWSVTIHEPTEADARAKMLIYLLENNLTSL